MLSWPRYPTFYEINTWVWLRELEQDRLYVELGPWQWHLFRVLPYE